MRLASAHDVDLVIVAASPALLETGRPGPDLDVILESTACDVAVLAGTAEMAEGSIVTSFAGVEHDWAAIEVAAWLAGALGTTLRLLGTEADPALGRRDASRLLARASLLVQQVVGILTEPVLVPPGDEGVLGAARDARMLVVGLSDCWRIEGIGRAPPCRCGGRPRADALRATRPPAERRCSKRDADALHVDTFIRTRRTEDVNHVPTPKANCRL